MSSEIPRSRDRVRHGEGLKQAPLRYRFWAPGQRENTQAAHHLNTSPEPLQPPGPQDGLAKRWALPGQTTAAHPRFSGKENVGQASSSSEHVLHEAGMEAWPASQASPPRAHARPPPSPRGMPGVQAPPPHPPTPLPKLRVGEGGEGGSGGRLPP